MKITLENEEGEVEVYVDDEGRATSVETGRHFHLKGKPTNLPGERWESESGETFWRK